MLKRIWHTVLGAVHKIGTATMRGTRYLKRESVNLARDACLLAGFFGVVRGVWLIYEPAAWIIGGGMLLWVGLPAKPPRKGGDRR